MASVNLSIEAPKRLMLEASCDVKVNEQTVQIKFGTTKPTLGFSICKISFQSKFRTQISNLFLGTKIQGYLEIYTELLESHTGESFERCQEVFEENR